MQRSPWSISPTSAGASRTTMWRRHGDGMLPSHRRAIADIIACRSEALGGHLWRCEACRAEVYAYHSCGNRSCPRMPPQADRTLARRPHAPSCWIAPYFHITVTVPVPSCARSCAPTSVDGYAFLMKAAAGAIIELARDPRHVGAQVGVLAVLHTWTQQLHYHPHVHCLVTGGGISDDGAASGTRLGRASWWPGQSARQAGPRQASAMRFARKRPDLKLPASRLAQALGRARHRLGHGPAGRARLPGALHCPGSPSPTTGSSPSPSRGSPSDTRSARPTGCAPAASRAASSCAGSSSHVLPKGLHKVRYFGLWHPSRRAGSSSKRACCSRASGARSGRRTRRPGPRPPGSSPDVPSAPAAGRVASSTSAVSAPATRWTITRPRQPSTSPAPSRAAARRLRPRLCRPDVRTRPPTQPLQPRDPSPTRSKWPEPMPHRLIAHPAARRASRRPSFHPGPPA